ncbi:MAG: hypothetical protein ACREVE_15985 [Gammaproteobacteria bacterium]
MRTSAGRYSFNLAELDLTFASNLLVRAVAESTGTQLQAFVTHSRVDIDPVSETAVRLALEQLASVRGPLTNFTPGELARISAAIDLITNVNDVGAETDIESSVGTLYAFALNQDNFRRFVVAAAGRGETNRGRGDIGEYVPLTIGAEWKYRVTEQPPAGLASHSSRTVTAQGVRPIGNARTTVLVVADDYYHSRGATSVKIHRILRLRLPNRVVEYELAAARATPFTRYTLPPVLGLSVQQFRDLAVAFEDSAL